LVLFDVEKFKRIETGGLFVPMNLGQLMNSLLVEIDDFRFEKFRVNGLHVEQSGKNEHTLYVLHNFYHPEERCISVNVSRITLEIDNVSLIKTGDWETIFTADPCLYPEEDKHGYEPFSGQMSGGPIANYDEDHLLVSVGSHHRDGIKYESLTMDPSSSFGKIILLNKQTGDYSIYASGLRNSKGMNKDDNGKIWITDHGPQGGDELNVVEKGKNFGWPEVSYGINYGNKPWPLAKNQGRHDRYNQPVFVGMPSVATTSIIGIKGNQKFQLWQNDLLVGSLKDKSLHRLRIQGEDRIIYSERIRLDHRIRDLTTLQDGTIALITDEGLLILVEDGGPVYEETGLLVEVRASHLDMFHKLQGENIGENKVDSHLKAENIFMQKCSGCHYLQEINSVGPHLKNILTRNVGEADGFNYSSSLSKNNSQWTPELMKSFLINPSENFQNTAMQQISLTEDETNQIIEFLKRK